MYHLTSRPAAQFLRLERFVRPASGCHLAIDSMDDRSAHLVCDARIGLITHTNDLILIEYGLNADPIRAVLVA